MDIVRPLVTSEDYVVQKHTKAHPFKAMGRVQASVYRASLFNTRYLLVRQVLLYVTIILWVENRTALHIFVLRSINSKGI